MVWYGKDHSSLLSLDEVMVAIHNHDLIAVSPSAELLPVISVDDPVHAADYAVLRPAAWGALDLITQAYKKCGGASQIRLTDLTRSVELNGLRYKRLAASKQAPPSFEPGKPLWPPKPNPVHDEFDFHTIGLEFDIERPADPDDRMILDYCIGYFEDRGIILRMESKASNSWEILPNPKYDTALETIAKKGKPPQLVGL
jgi:hypothetical protein